VEIILTSLVRSINQVSSTYYYFFPEIVGLISFFSPKTPDYDLEYLFNNNINFEDVPLYNSRYYDKSVVK